MLLGLPGGDTCLTSYLAPVATNAMWTGTAATVKLQDVTDGTSNTIFLVDAADKLAVPWTKPADYRYDPKDPAAGLAYRYGKFVYHFVLQMAQDMPRPLTIDAQDDACAVHQKWRRGGFVLSW